MPAACLLAGLPLGAQSDDGRIEITTDQIPCICPSGGTGSITVIAEGSAGPFTFLWAGPGGYVSTGQNPADLPAPGWYTVAVTNAFSPNGDGINDHLTVFAGDDVAAVRSFRIFDRWGGVVFERFNFPPNVESLGWDGSVRGRPAPAGSYVYTATWERPDGETAHTSGEVMLVR